MSLFGRFRRRKPEKPGEPGEIRVSAATVQQPVESIEMCAIVTCGPETAARLGVPVGTRIDLGRQAYFHRDPEKMAEGIAEINTNHELSG